jgi:replicative DNA helicase
MTCGFLENEFVIIGARPAVGKTQLLIKFALNISKTTPVLFLEYGLFEQALGTRFMAAITDIDSWKIARKNLSQSEWNQLDRRIAPYFQYQLFVNSHPETDMQK